MITFKLNNEPTNNINEKEYLTEKYTNLSTSCRVEIINHKD
jgi:hypothetical protein